MSVVSLLIPSRRAHGWTNQEFAEFYRVENSLIRAGLSIDTDHGLSDEGDPWFVFCHSQSGDIIIHFARIDGSYAVASPAFDHCKRGADFRSLIQALIETYPLAIAKANGDARISIHPAALMVAVVMTCFFKLAQTQALASQFGAGEAQTNPAAGVDHDTAMKSGSVVVEDRRSTMLLTAIAFATSCASGTADSTLFAVPAVTDIVTSVVFTSNSEHADAGFNFLDTSDLTFEHVGQPEGHAPSVLGVLSIDDVVAPKAGLGQFHAMFETPNTVAFDSAPINMAPKLPLQDSGEANVALHSTDPNVGNLAWLPGINLTLEPKGAIGTASPPATITAPESLNAVVNSLGGQVSQHLILDFSGDQPQLVLNLVERDGVTPAGHVAAHSGTGTPDQAGYAAFLQSGSLPSTVSVSETSVSSMNSPVKLAAFANALNSFTSAHPDFHVLELPADVVVFDTHLNSGNIDYASVAIWTFADGSHVTLIGVVAPHGTHGTPPG